MMSRTYLRWVVIGGLSTDARASALRSSGRSGRRYMPIVGFPVANILLVVIVILVLVVALKSIRIADQYERAVVFRLGKYHRTAGPGLYVVWFPVEWQT